MYIALLILTGDCLLLGRPDLHNLPGQTGRQVGLCANSRYYPCVVGSENVAGSKILKLEKQFVSIFGWSSIYRCTTGVFSRFQFEESVSTFTAGLFSLERGKPVPALVYVTFNGRIQVQT